MNIFDMIGASAAISMALGGPALAAGIGLDTFYFGAVARWDYADYDSGGFNTVGAFNNTNNDSGGSSVGSIFAGFEDIASFDPVSLRAEIEGMLVGQRGIVTDSFAPPTPTFFYQTSVRSYVGLVNLWADIWPFTDLPVIFSAGGDIGFAHHEIETNDVVVGGDGNDTTLAYAIGAQAAYEFASAVSVGVMGRYTDFGKPEIDLTGGGGGPAGDYTLDHTGV